MVAKEAAQKRHPVGCKGVEGGNPSMPESSGDDDDAEDRDEEEGEITSSPHSSLPEVFPSPGDLFS
jgi:hypothetical protein